MTKRIGVIVPSTNVAVEDEYGRMRVPGVSFHTGRIMIHDEALDGDDGFERFLELLRPELDAAVAEVMTCRPEMLVMGMSAETFWGGVEGADDFVRRVEDLAGVPVITGASACQAALEEMGARRIGIITPYQPVGDDQVRRYFEDTGFEVHAVRGLKCPTATAIADVGPDELVEAFLAVDGDDVDVLVQAGTNLLAVEVAAQLDTRLGKPVIAINAATLWYAYRTLGIRAELPGYGRLFACA